MWADFFYVQLVVIWYGNLPEETNYVILRTMLPPWRPLAWTVFFMCFIIPFLVLINKRVKTKPRFMMGLCGMVIVGMWLEHLLLIGPALNHAAAEVPLGITDGLIFVGFSRADGAGGGLHAQAFSGADLGVRESIARGIVIGERCGT